MNFEYAWARMMEGKKVKRRDWEGYWAWEDNTIKMHCRDGIVLDIRETNDVMFTITNTLAKDWCVVEE